MLLDNRQAIPDIVISRHGVPNMQRNGYIENNERLAGRINGTRRETQSGIPKKVSDPPKHLFSSGNNNGSPRHVPQNGNIYLDDQKYNLGGNKLKQVISPKKPSYPGRYQNKEGKSNIPLPRKPNAMVCNSKRNMIKFRDTSTKAIHIGKEIPQRMQTHQSNYNNLFAESRNYFEDRQVAVPNHNSKYNSSANPQSEPNDANRMSVNKLNPCLESNVTNYKENSASYEKISNLSGNSFSINFDEANQCNQFTETIGDTQNYNTGLEKGYSLDSKLLISIDSLIDETETPSCQNLENFQIFEWSKVNQNGSYYMDIDKSEEENDKILASNHIRPLLTGSNGSIDGHSKLSSLEDIKDLSFDSEEIKLLSEDECSSSETSSSYECKMAVVQCNGHNYLTKLLVNDTDIHGLKIVGRIGIGSKRTGHGMSLENPEVSGQVQYNALRKDIQTENASNISSQSTEYEFEHEAADYQWLLDYENALPLTSMSYDRYRENYSRDSLPTGKDGSVRISILQTAENAGNFSYEAISRNLDANLAEIDMDDFRSEDIHQILSLPSVENEHEDNDNERYEEEYQHNMCSNESYHLSYPETSAGQEEIPTDILVNDAKDLSYNYPDCTEDGECSGVSGDASLYKSGPLFSPVREPIPPSFSVDSLDSGSIHEDLILTCQANKNNYTIAFEGSFVHNSSNSDYRDTGASESGESATWSTENLDNHISASDMTHSDQPYTTWSRVSRRLSQTPDSEPNSSVVRHENTPIPKCNPSIEQYQRQRSKQQTNESKSSSMPNLMRRSLMRKSFETSGQCMKVYDLQKSLRSSHLLQSKLDANNFSLLRLFMKQKSLGKDGFTRSSSFTDRSNDGCYSSSENHSTNNDSSDWPMNSQSETELEGNSSPMQSLSPNIKQKNKNNIDIQQDNFGIENTSTETLSRFERIERLNNNNSLANHIDNVSLHLNSIENLNSFDDNLRDAITCSKPPMTSPIREEPEGMEMSVHKEIYTAPKIKTSFAWDNTEKSKKEFVLNEANKIIKSDLGNIVKEGKVNDSIHQKSKEVCKKEILKQNLENVKNEYGRRLTGNDTVVTSKTLEERNTVGVLRERPKPRPRITKESVDQCLQTSNLRGAATVNTSKILDSKEVYVYYPNYALPDLNFLKEKKYNLDTKIFLVPQHYGMSEERLKSSRAHKTDRPLSHHDITKLKRENFSHVEDWESLNLLLPKELKEILRDSSDCMETTKPTFCRPIKASRRTVSCDFSPHRNFNESKASSTSVNSNQPSSGYRGSSTMLNDSDLEDTTLAENPTKCLNFIKRVRNVPSTDMVSHDTNQTGIQPLPKGVLRKCTSIKGSKRNSCDIDNKIRMREELLKRRSLPEFDERKEEKVSCKNSATNKGNLKQTKSLQCSCINYCTGFCSTGLRRKKVNDPGNLPNIRKSTNANGAEIKNLKAHVSSQLSSKNITPGIQKATGNERPSELLIRKNIEGKRNEAYHYAKLRGDLKGQDKCIQQVEEDLSPMLYDLSEKKTLVISVRSAVEKLVSYFQLATPRERIQTINSQNCSDAAELVLNKLCPAIYALLSDGLLPSLHSLFGKITNSVWKVVETTSQLGPSTKALHDLVMTLNGEECLTEGPIKCNAFIFGLLNLRSVDAWLSYLRTREVALQKHYHPESFLYLANTAMRSLFDDLLLAVRPLALLPFHLDILFEYKALHASLLKMEELFLLASRRGSNHEIKQDSLFDHLVDAKESKEYRNVVKQQDRIRTFMNAVGPQVEIRRDRSNSPRPRSCYEGEHSSQDVEDCLRKRWSGVQLGSKLVTALDKLLSDGDDGSCNNCPNCLDSPEWKSHKNCAVEIKAGQSSSKYENVIEHSATDKDSGNEKFSNHPYPTCMRRESEGDRFRKLQLKWEQMAIHPLRHRNPQTANGNRSENSVSPGCSSRSRIPRPVSMTSPQRPYKLFAPTNIQKEKPQPIPRRSLKDKISSTDLPGRNVVKSRLKNKKLSSTSTDSSRASSVPGRGIDHVAPVARYDIYRRNAGTRSSSQGREVIENFRYVQTLHHRLATDNGHLSFNKGDLLSVVIDVDEKFILCCLNDRKGIVPRNSVIPFDP